MREYSEQQLVELVAKRPEVNFLAAAITPWHAIGIDATILQLQSQGIELKGYICIVSHPITGTAITEQNFHMATQNIEIIYLTSGSENRSLRDKVQLKIQKYAYYLSNSYKQKNLGNRTILYWAVPLKPSFELIPRMAEAVGNRKLHIVITDEGLASYTMNTFAWWRFAFLEGGIKSGIRGTWNILLRDVFFMHRLISRGQIQYSQLLLRQGKEWKPNIEMITFFRKVLAMETYEEDYSYYGNAILINPNKLFESGVLKDQTETNVYQEICEAMAKREVPVIIKPHPREQDLAKYKDIPCILEKKGKVAQETILATLSKKPYCVIGFSSTTLVTAKLLFDIDAISANYLAPKESLRDKKYFNSFNRTFRGLLYMPQDKEELLQDIDEIVSKAIRRNEIKNEK